MATIIAVLIALGLIGTPEEFNSLDEQQQQELTEIVIMDEVNS